MFFVQLLDKMLHVQIKIVLPVQPQDFLHLGDGHPLRTRSPHPPIKQPVVAILLPMPSPPPQLSIRHAQNLGRLNPIHRPCHHPRDHILDFHCPFQSSDRIKVHSLRPPLRMHYSPSPAFSDRTFHLLRRPDTSCASD